MAAPRGLSFNEDKTRVVHLSEGFDFLGWNFRRYPGAKLLIKPSKAAVGKHRKRLAARCAGCAARTRHGHRHDHPVIRGWTGYHRGMVSSDGIQLAGHHTWTLTWKWARWTHPNKGRQLGRRPLLRQVLLLQARQVGLRRPGHRHLPAQDCLDDRRHVMVKGGSSPDDPDLARILGRRRKKGPRWTAPPSLLARQDGRCPLCGRAFSTPDHLPVPQDWQGWCPARHQRGHRGGLPGPPDTPGANAATDHTSYTPPATGAGTRPGTGNPALQQTTDRPSGLPEPGAGNPHARF